METIFNKAKRYDEAVINGSRLWESGIITRENYEYIFPALKESEDERIRKAIHIYLDWLDGRKEIAPRGEYSIRDMISWLEKQGEQKQKQYDIDVLEKHITKDSISELAHTVIVRNGWEIVDANKQKPTSEEDEIEIPFGAKDSELQESTYAIPKGFHAEIDDDKVVIKKGEKPTAWSEEDEKMIDRSITNLAELMHRYGAEYGKVGKCIDWLKSFKKV